MDIAHNETSTEGRRRLEAEDAGFQQPRGSRSVKLENKGGSGCLCRTSTSKGTNGLQRKCAISDFQPTPLTTQRQGGCWTYFSFKNYDRISRKCKVR